VSAITAAIPAQTYCVPQSKLSWIKTVLTFQRSVLSSRAALVAGIGAALALSALASLSPEPPRANAAQMPRAPIAASLAYSHDPLVILARR
jgi:hypothetical protein